MGARLVALLGAFAFFQIAPTSALSAQSEVSEFSDTAAAFDLALPADPRGQGAADAVPLDPPSLAAAKVIAWVTASHDNGDLPFVVIDKNAAELLAFDPSGQLLNRAPVLVGITKGDDSSPGVGDRELSDIPVADRTTPAGRFVAKFGWAAGHEEKVIWVDYTDAISLHAVVTSKPKERRVARLRSPTPTDNRITYGCINVDAKFYNDVIEPLFKPAGAVVYVLPETRSLHETFAGISPDDDLPAPEPFDHVFADFQLGTTEPASLTISR